MPGCGPHTDTSAYWSHTLPQQERACTEEHQAAAQEAF